MQQISRSSFGLVIAYLLPGFLGLIGISFHSSGVRSWLTGNPQTEAVSLGGFLFSTLAALALGLICSTVRWMLLDTLHHRTGIRPPRRNFRLLEANLGAYRLIEENHYQYYQFYGNSLVALLIGYGGYRGTVGNSTSHDADLVFLCVAALLYLGSRDTLQKYYSRVRELLSESSSIILPGSQAREKYGSTGPRGRRRVSLRRRY